MKKFVLLSLSLSGFLLLSGCSSGMNSGSDREKITDLHSDLDYVRHEQDNYQVETKMLQGKIEAQQSAISVLQEQLLDFQQKNKKLVSGNIATFEDRLAGYEKTQASLVDDLRQLKTATNDLSVSILQYKRKVKEFEETIEKQNKNIHNLEIAFESILAALDKKKSSPTIAQNSPSNINQISNTAVVATASSAARTYKVKSGDTLERIAKLHNTSVKVLKERNKLKDDLIVVGQELQIPAE